MCFIGERNFESFILEARRRIHEFVSGLVSDQMKMNFHRFVCVSSTSSRNQGTSFPSRTGPSWEHTKVRLVSLISDTLVPVDVSSITCPLCASRLVHSDVGSEGADRRAEGRLVCGGQRCCFWRCDCGEKHVLRRLQIKTEMCNTNMFHKRAVFVMLPAFRLRLPTTRLCSVTRFEPTASTGSPWTRLPSWSGPR